MKRAATSLKLTLYLFGFLIVLLIGSISLQTIGSVQTYSTSVEELINELENANNLSTKSYQNIQSVIDAHEYSVIFVSTNWCGTCIETVQRLLTEAENYPIIHFYKADLEANRSFMNDIDVFKPETIIFTDSNNYVVLRDYDLNAFPIQLNQLLSTGTTFL